MKNNLLGILPILILFQIVCSTPTYTQEVDSYSNKIVQTDTLRTIGRAVEAGIMYKKLYYTQLNTTAMLDSLLNKCNEYAKTKPTTIVETKTNWWITTAVAVGVLLANWTIYLTLNK